MSNQAGDIDEVIGAKAFENVTLMVNRLGELRAVYNGTVKDVVKGMQEMGNASGIKAVTTNIDSLNTKSKKLTEVQTEFIETQRNVDKAFRNTGDVINKLERNYADVTNKATAMRNENRKIIADNNAMKVSIQTVDQQWKLLESDYKRLTIEARNMGAAHGVMSKEFKTSAASANIVRKEMDEINKVLGHSQANVGNYASGLNKVWGGLRQLAYIVPGLGIAGIFNLAGEAIGMAFAKLNLFDDKVKQFKNTILEGTRASTEEITNLDRLYKKTQDVTVEIDKRKNAVDKLQELYPHYFKNIKDEIFLNGGAKESYDELRIAIVEMAKVKAIESKISEIINGDMEEELKLRDNLQKATAKNILDKGKSMGYSGQYGQGGAVGQLSAQEADRYRQTQVNDANMELAIFQDKQNKKLKIYTDYLKKQEDIETDVLKKADPEGKGNSTKDGNRIEAIKKQYEDEVSLLKTKLNKEEITEEVFYSRMIDLSRKYYDEREGLSEKEKHSEIKFNEELSKSEKDNHDNILKWLDDETKAAADADWVKLKSSLERIEKIRKANEKLYQEELDYIKGQMDAQQRMHDEDDRLAQQNLSNKMKYLNSTNELVQASTSALSSVGDIMFMRDMERIETKNKALKEYYDNELRFIEQSGLSTKEKASEKKKLDAEVAARQKQLDRDRISAMRKQASIQKGIDIASLIGSTTVAVMAALGAKPYTPLNIAMAAGAAAKGAGELARLIATPLPQYAKGRKGGPATLAKVSEEGQEIVKEKSGRIWLTPKKESTVFIPEGADVLPADVTKQIMNAAYVKLSTQGTVTPDNYQRAVLEAHEEEIEELRGLRIELRKKNMNSTFQELGSHYYSYKESNRL